MSSSSIFLIVICLTLVSAAVNPAPAGSVPVGGKCDTYQQCQKGLFCAGGYQGKMIAGLTYSYKDKNSLGVCYDPNTTDPTVTLPSGQGCRCAFLFTDSPIPYWPSCSSWQCNGDKCVKHADTGDYWCSHTVSQGATAKTKDVTMASELDFPEEADDMGVPPAAAATATASSSSSPSVLVIVLPIVGGCVALMAVAIAVCVYRRRAAQIKNTMPASAVEVATV